MTTDTKDDAAVNDAILTRQCEELAYQIVGNHIRPSAVSTAAAIKKLAEQWADGQREVDALIAEEHCAVAAMAIRGQLPSE